MFFSHIAAMYGLVNRLRQYRYGCLGIATAIMLMLLPLASSVQAQADYPAFQDPYVNDYAEVLTPTEENTVRTQLEQFRSRTGQHAVVLTIRSIQDYPTPDSTLESFATNLFNTWRIGDAARNDGILILVAPGDRKVRIELGSGFPRRADDVAQTIIDDKMLPHFRQGQMNLGTIAGVEGVVQRLQLDQVSSFGPSGDLGIGERIIEFISGAIAVIFQAGIFIVGAIGAAGVFLFRRWQRFRKRQCPRCHTEMRRLDETADDRYLDVPQRREESLESVDYDVWLCPSCGHHTTQSFTNWFSRYKNCPKCKRKTLAVHTETITHPTYSHSGRARVEETCKYCSHSRTYTKTLPKKVRSSSSHGGGGRSSGGGASSSW